MSFKGLRMLKISKLPDFEKKLKKFKKYPKGGPLAIFLTFYFTQHNYRRLLECYLEVLEC